MCWFVSFFFFNFLSHQVAAGLILNGETTFNDFFFLQASEASCDHAYESCGFQAFQYACASRVLSPFNMALALSIAGMNVLNEQVIVSLSTTHMHSHT